jgi:hypothetical protein
MVVKHAASLLSPRFSQRLHKAREETFVRFSLRAFGNSSSGGASAPIGHSIHQFFLLEDDWVNVLAPVSPRRLIVS